MPQILVGQNYDTLFVSCYYFCAHDGHNLPTGTVISLEVFSW